MHMQGGARFKIVPMDCKPVWGRESQDWGSKNVDGQHGRLQELVSSYTVLAANQSILTPQILGEMVGTGVHVDGGTTENGCAIPNSRIRQPVLLML